MNKISSFGIPNKEDSPEIKFEINLIYAMFGIGINFPELFNPTILDIIWRVI